MTSVTLSSAGSTVPREGERDTPTFDAVYQMHAQTVARWAARLGGPGADVEDITQEVFLVVNRRLGEFRHDSQLATWLFSITAKVAANDRRRRKVRDWWLRLVPRIEDRVADGRDKPITPIEQLEKRERRTQFYAALDALGERQRRALVLFELEDMSVSEIATLMGLRAGNVRVLLHRARAAFLKQVTAGELREAMAIGRRTGSEEPR